MGRYSGGNNVSRRKNKLMKNQNRSGRPALKSPTLALSSALVPQTLRMVRYSIYSLNSEKTYRFVFNSDISMHFEY